MLMTALTAIKALTWSTSTCWPNTQATFFTLNRALLRQKLSVPDKYGTNRAKMIATAKAAQSADVVSGSGQLDVFRYGSPLKARRLVEVRGAGRTYDGLYYVQSFTVSRNALVAKSANGLI